MALRGMIFDIDGTQVDTNPSHVEAWRRAFTRFGFDIPAARIKVEIGKGGDKLVPSSWVRNRRIGWVRLCGGRRRRSS